MVSARQILAEEPRQYQRSLYIVEKYTFSVQQFRR